ncbi:uncharacterized protein C19orf47-like [Oscarella lobularis]|uniref:uncharacterized protein C19orf47-like n=1 Tax=Oscarella lobularis TaxID=121494 RepID=UPI00331375CE
MEWTTFFKEAGLPQSVAAEYAVVFNDNRMKFDMLADITKDILTEMGIRKMGDILAIVRHAKTVHTQEVRKREASLVKSSPLQKSVVTPLKQMPTGGAAALPASRVSSKVEPVKPKPKLRIEQEKLPTSWLKPDVQLAMVAKQNRARKVIAPSSLSSIDSRTVKRRADDAGSYTIKMPQGLTNKTRQVLQRQAEKASKPAIFSRLGSSSSDDSSIFGRLGSSTPTQRIITTPITTTPSVQSRLGGMNSSRLLRQDKESASPSSVFDRLGSNA